MNRHVSYMRLQSMAEEFRIRSGLMLLGGSPEGDPGRKGFWQDLQAPGGQVLRFRRVHRAEDSATDGVFRLLCEEFTEDEADPLDVIKADVSDPNTCYFILQGKEGDPGNVLGLANCYVLPVGASGLQLFIGYLVTNKEFRHLTIAASLYSASLLFFMRRSEVRAREAIGIIGEMVEEVETYFVKACGARRLYLETGDGVCEVQYMQPPLDWNLETGDPKTKPVPEHLMVRLIDGRDEMTSTELEAMVWSMYESYFFDEKDFENVAAFRRHNEVITGLFAEFQEGLRLARDGRIFMVNHRIRGIMGEDLARAGKKLIEVEA